jgi:hypothetical protein
MWFSSIRFRNRLLQVFYRPGASRSGIFAFPERTLSVFDEIDSSIEEKITPLLADFF